MMYSASTASVGSSGSTLVGVATREPGPPPVSTVTSVPASSGPLFDPIYDATGVCFCHRFLNPFGVGASQCLVNPCLLHYCRVCNIQLNSCRQAKIHSEGKKHEKRLSYLKFCLESTDSSQNGVAANLTAASGIPPNTMMASTNTSASTPQAYYISQQQQQQQQQPPPQQQQQPVPHVPPAASCQPPVNYQQQPTVAASTAYYYQQSPAPPPPTTAVAQPPPPASMATYPMMPTSTASYYADYTSPPPSMAAAQPPPPPHQAPPPPHPQQGTVVHMVPTSSHPGVVTGGVAGVPPGSYHLEMHQAVTSAPPSMQAASAPPIPVHSVMSPSLTSGFSGSGDCKSTETSSILSAASYSSGAINGNNNNNNHHHTSYHHYEPVGGHGGHGGYYSSKRGSNGGSGGYNAGGGHPNNNSSSSNSSNNNNYYQPSHNHINGSSNGHEVVGGYHHQHAVNNYVNNPAGLHSNGHVLGVGGHRGHHYHHHHHPSRSSSSYTSTSNTAGGSSNSSSSAASSKSSHNNSNNIHNHNNNKSVFCETCQIPFPSVAVLDNHLKGSRHARRVKSQQAFRQLKESGTLFRFRGSSAPVSDLGMSSGAIRCEVCQVSVNSSHQLQAHITGHKHKVRAIRRGVKTNQAVLSPSSSLLTSVSSNYSSSGNVVPPSSKLAISSSSGSGGSIALANNGVKNNNNNNNGATTTTSRHRRSSVKNSSKTPSQQRQQPEQQQQQQQQQQQSSTKAQKNQQESSGRNLALSRHRSSGCLQSRHCHSTLSLSRARSSSALNRVQSRSMNLLMIQANGMTNGTTVASNSSNASSNSSVVLVDDEEDEGVATDATTEGQLNSKDIKSTSTTTTGKKPLIQTSRPRRSQGGKAKTKDVKDSTHKTAQEMAWLKLSKSKNKKDSVNGNTPHHDKSTKILKNGFNVNAQEWKPSRRTSVGNTSVKDIPMLDMFLQRLGDRHSYSDPCSVPNGESAVNGPVTGGGGGSPGADPSAGVPTPLKAGGPPGNSEKESTRA